MTHVDLFTGIGGFALAASWVWREGHQPLLFCEIGSFPRKVLRKHWPHVPIHADIKTLNADQLLGRVDLLTGGFPCQPYSVAGKGYGDLDDRALWREMVRVARECRPRWIVGENVTRFLEMGFDAMRVALEGEGYEVWPVVLPACAVNAIHRRDRLWIIAHQIADASNSHCVRKLQPERLFPNIKRWADNGVDASAADSKRTGSDILDQRPGEGELWGSDPWNDGVQWPTEPPLCRADDGVSSGIYRDRAKRVGALGASVVPTLVAEIFRGVQAVDYHRCTNQQTP